jgi:hypothetical protein
VNDRFEVSTNIRSKSIHTKFCSLWYRI